MRIKINFYFLNFSKKLPSFLGVTSPQSTGLGGGFVMTIYRKETNKVETLIARDVAPLKATEDMFVNTNATGGKGLLLCPDLDSIH